MKSLAMKLLLAAGLSSPIAMPSFAQDTTTVQYILAKGVAIHADLYGRPVDMRVTYSQDGTSVTNIIGAGGQGAQVPGKWRVDGGKFCTSNLANPTENCFDIPAGKKPGDSFKVTTPALGEITMTIN